ncbi:MAG: N-acetylmuramic acid 6-phosphate etherase [Bacteroidota bacterium]
MSKKTTEQDSRYDHLDKMSTLELLQAINQEDQTVPLVIAGILPQIELVIDQVFGKMQEGGRLFYLGSGTSGRLGIVDASECPPTYGVPSGWVIGLIAGGKEAVHQAVEFAEDSLTQGWEDLQRHQVSEGDVVVGITASGTTPYVLGAMDACHQHNILTVGITCNADSPLEKKVQLPIVAVVGPEVVTGSTRMKAGTAQKLILNMISTSVMVKLGRVIGNKMIDMQLSNNKLIERGTRMITDLSGVDPATAQRLLLLHKSVRAVLHILEDRDRR